MHDELQPEPVEPVSSSEESQQSPEAPPEAEGACLRTRVEALTRRNEALTRRNEALLSMIESSQVVCVFVDEQLHLRHLTRAARELFHLGEREAGCTLDSLPEPFQGGDLAEDVRQVLLTGVPRERQVRMESREAWYLVRIFPQRVTDSGIDGAALRFIDVTQLKEAQLRAARLAAIVESTSDAVIGRTFDGTIISWNRGAEQLYGYFADEMLGKNFDLLVPDERREELEGLEAQIRAGLSPPTVETVRLTRDGRRIYISLTLSPLPDEAGRPVGISAISRDVTGRKQAEETLSRLNSEHRRATEELRTILELVPIGIAVSHDRDSTFIAGNRICAELLRMPPGTNLSKSGPEAGRLPFRVFREGLEIRWEELPMQRAAAQGIEAPGEELELRFNDGTTRTVVIAAVPLLDEAGQSRGAVASFLDITQQKRVAEELKQASDRKDEFLAMLGHELRNPLAAITNSLALLRWSGPDPERGRRAWDIVTRQLRYLDHLVDDLLDVARISRGQIRLRLEPVDLLDVVRQTVDDYRPSCEVKGLKLEATLPKEPVRAMGDRDRLAQVIGNLLSNSLRYTDEGCISVTLATAQNEAVVTVTDTGVGIEPELLSHLFVPFMQGPLPPNRARGGLGVGLALGRTLMDMHHGSLEGYSAGRGKGACFTLRLPLNGRTRE